MAIVNSAGAKVRLILATRDLDQSNQLVRDIKQSAIPYVVDLISDPNGVDSAITDAVAGPVEMATVIVLDYTLTTDITGEIAARIKSLSATFPVECVVVNPPDDARARAGLTALGVTLYDDAGAALGAGASFH